MYTCCCVFRSLLCVSCSVFAAAVYSVLYSAGQLCYQLCAFGLLIWITVLCFKVGASCLTLPLLHSSSSWASSIGVPCNNCCCVLSAVQLDGLFHIICFVLCVCFTIPHSAANGHRLSQTVIGGALRGRCCDLMLNARVCVECCWVFGTML